MVHKTGQPSRSLLEVGVQGPVFRGLHSSGEAVYGNVLLGGGFPLVLSSWWLGLKVAAWAPLSLLRSLDLSESGDPREKG